MKSESTPPKPIYVYVLTDPRYPDDVRYVGITDNLDKRLKLHIRDNRQRTHRTNWIKSLLADGLKPIMTEIDKTDEDNWIQCEMRWIAYYRGIGCNLVNSTDGGEGTRGLVFNNETRRRMSESKQNPTDETRRKMSESRRDYHRRKMCEAGGEKPKAPKPSLNKKPVLQYDGFGHFIRRWDSAGEAGRKLDISNQTISACCNKKPQHKTAGGYIWRYENDPLLGEYPTQLRIDFE